MVSISVSGIVVSEIHSSTTASGIERTSFTVESDDSVSARQTDRCSLPLRFEIMAFGSQAERAATTLKMGTPINLFGRMSGGKESKKVTITLSGFEIQGGPADAR